MTKPTKEIEAKVLQAMSDQGHDAFVAVGPDNITYQTGISLPFATHYPDRRALSISTRDGQHWLLCPPDWEQAIQDQGWGGNIRAYSETTALPPIPMVESLIHLLKELHLQAGRIGVDFSRAPTQFMDLVITGLPRVQWVAGDDLVKHLRLEKTEKEVEFLETACRHSELGIIGALNHMEGSLDGFGYHLSEFSERVRIHAYEAGASGVGHLSTLQGTESQQWYGLHGGKFLPGNLFRMEVTNHFQGYWSNGARMAVMGEPTDRVTIAYGQNLLLKSAALERLRPGNRCNDVFEEVKRVAEKEGIRLCEEAGMGHGVGVSEREAPYLLPGDRTILKRGMVLVLAIYSYGPHGELMGSKDTYEIVPEGHRLLSWFRNWDKLYSVIGFRAAH
jgi:Xaa-Pro aminopeptidase